MTGELRRHGRRRKAVAVLTAAALIALAGCAGRPVQGDFSPGPASSGQGAGAFPVTPVAWHPCPDVVAEQGHGQADARFTYSCGTANVPQDWVNPTGPTFQIALLRAKLKNQSNRIGSLLVNPGGPGGSGIGLALDLAGGLPSDVTQRFDIVGFDPRGIGLSSPVACIPNPIKDQSTEQTVDPVSQQQFDQQVALARQIGQLCQQKYPTTLGLFSTEQTARDLDALRAAVGDPKISYLGFSYGTELGAVYAHLFPANIRAFVLDGAVDPQLTDVQSSEGQAAGFEKAFSNFAADCQQHGSACPISSDPRGTVIRMLQRLKADPIPLSDGRQLTDGLAFTGVIQALYARSLWPVMASAVSEALSGSPDRLLQLADQYNGREANGSYNNEVDANTTVNCDDDGNPITLDRVRELQSQWRSKYPLMGAPLAMSLVGCVVWPAKRDPYQIGAATGAPPIVVVGTTNDPATPYKNTARLASLLGTGVVLTWQGEGHTAYPQTQCIRNAVDDYLIDGKAPAPNTVCPPG